MYLSKQPSTHDFRKTALREDWCPGLQVPFQDFVLCPRVRFEIPNDFSWCGHRGWFACGFLRRFLNRCQLARLLRDRIVRYVRPLVPLPAVQ